MGEVVFLVVDDEDLVRRSLCQLLKQYGSCEVASSASEASGRLSLRRWDGLLIDVRLGEASGLDVLAAARAGGVDAPALIMTGSIDHDVVNRAAALDARIVSKPCGLPELAPFISAVLSRDAGEPAAAGAERARARWGLTRHESLVLMHAMRGGTREDYLREMGVTANTYKTHVGRILDKTGAESLASLALRVLNEAIRTSR